MTFRRKGDKNKYAFIDKRCIGRSCWAPGMYQHRAPLASGGSRNTGSPDSPCCLNRAYRGCPAGPEGERKDICEWCHGRGYTTQAIDISYPATVVCGLCGQSGFVTVAGVPEFNPELAKERKAQGWRAA